MTVDVCEKAIRAILEAHWQRASTAIDGDITPDLDGHSMLTRLKVAATFGLLDGRVGVNNEDWELAGIVMAHSLRVRTVVEEVQKKMAAESNVRSAHAAAVRTTVIEEKVGAQKVQTTGKKIVEKLRGNGWMKRRALRRLVGPHWATWFDEALDHLLAAGTVEPRSAPGQGTTCTEYRIAP
jgi:hypothetical protein